MNGQTIFKLKQHVTKVDLRGAGFLVYGGGASRRTDRAYAIYIPLRKSSMYAYRVIQYAGVGTSPEDLNPEDIEDLVVRGWVDEIEI